MPDSMILSSRVGAYRRVFVADQAVAATTFANPSQTTARPSGTGIIDVSTLGAIPTSIVFKPYGQASANLTMIIGVWSWQELLADDNVSGSALYYTAELMFAATCTLSTASGTAGSAVAAANLYCDAITVTSGNHPVSVESMSAAGLDLACIIEMDTRGNSLFQVKMALNGSSAANNCLWRVGG